MSVQVHLDRSPSHFTSLEFISGRVVLSLLNNETISTIVVKLEGESRTRVLASQLPLQDQPRARHHAELECHKLLYKVLVVFPTEQLQRTPLENASYTLPAGQYEYPFQFKIPLNNDCHANAAYATSNVAGLLGEIARATSRHVKTTLPPSLNGSPGQAEIHYFVKATVQRPAFYKENFRALKFFNFLPIEPPRAAGNRRESYARRQHHFAPKLHVPSKKGFLRQPSIPSPDGSIVPPIICLDGRLPDPAIITCNEPLPLRILVSKLNESTATIYLQLLEVELVGHTITRAHQLQSTDSTSWVIMSVSNMRMPLANDRIGSSSDMEIDPKLWNQISLPRTVAPSFSTCNITRNYSLCIKVGLSYGSSDEIIPELAVQALQMPLEIYSGIAPPPEILSRMSDQWPTQGQSQPFSSQPQQLNQNLPPRPSQPLTPSFEHPQPSQTVPVANPYPQDAPPSYDEVIANNTAPVDGHGGNRANENTPKKSELNERLFPDNDRSYQ